MNSSRPMEMTFVIDGVRDRLMRPIVCCWQIGVKQRFALSLTAIDCAEAIDRRRR
jgi:hypothetical protein